MSAEPFVTGSEEAAGLAEELLAGLAAEVYPDAGRVVIVLQPGRLHEAALKLRDDKQLSFKYLSFAGGVDHKDRMEAIYILRSVNHSVVAELRAPLDRSLPVAPTVSDVWSTAGWHERETFDLLGIEYEGHPDLRRILTDAADGVHPLRKDSRPQRVKREEWRFEGIGAPRRLPGEEERINRS